MTKSVLISGAGVAGPALAFWLTKYGYTTTIVERAEELRDGGYKVDIRGAAVTVIERMGLLDDVRRLHTDIQDASYVDDDGVKRAHLDGDLFGGRSGGDAELMRGDLGRLLYDATASSTEYLFGDHITGLTETADGVDVEFASGLRRRFDLVVGADGLHSGVRALTFGPEEQFIKHLGAYVAIFSTPNHLGLDRAELLHLDVGRITNVYSTAGASNARAFFMFGSEPIAYERGQSLDVLRNAFAGARWENPRLLASAAEAPDFYFDSLSVVEMNRWSKGRIALVGDAAYCASPASGQGTSLALVGAYVLAGELAGAGFDDAFAAYEREMREFVAKNQQLGRANAKRMLPKSRGAIRFHLGFLRALPHLPVKRLISNAILKSIHGPANAISLKQY